ncbi:PIN domain-containing protein [bacterium]|nr:PIN domain-containing protein [bacterium]MCI0601539.1 PIN domain-containing protein [bacterium]
MAMILDTSIWISVESGRLAPADVADRTGDEAVYLAPPVIAELEYGLHRAKNAAQRNRRAAALARIKRKSCLLIDKDTAEIFGRLASDLDATRKPSTHRTHDVWLAALALQYDMAVVTQNERDFSDIPGLRLIVLPRS